MNIEERTNIYRVYIGTLAAAIYNEEGWDKQQMASYFHMGDSSHSYAFPEEPPARLEIDDFIAALDRIFERAGI